MLDNTSIFIDLLSMTDVTGNIDKVIYDQG